MTKKYILPLAAEKKSDPIGSKARHLGFLEKKGFRVPKTLICHWKAYQVYLQQGTRVLDSLREELTACLHPEMLYAVRSSANLEDGSELSFAGQFQSVLNLQGVESVLKAIQQIWDSAWTPQLRTYFHQIESKQQNIKMAAIIQEMISPQVSGVSFSKNPLTGLDEVIVEAVSGSGELLAQDGVTPFRWVNKWGTWIESPEQDLPEAQIPPDLIPRVVNQTRKIEKSFQKPVDLEWVFDGRELSWVQMREITSLNIPIYSNRISREVFPGLIKPLIWSVNVPLVNRAWMRLFTEMIGPNQIQPESLAGRFYCRAYFNMTTIGEIFELMGLPKETLELLLGIEVMGPERPSFKPGPKTYRLLPRILLFTVDKLTFGRKIQRFLSLKEKEFRRFDRELNHYQDKKKLLDRIDRLAPMVEETAYYNTVISLLARFYNQLLQIQLKRIGLSLDHWDLTGDLKEQKKQYDPAADLALLSAEYQSLSPETRSKVRDLPFQRLSEIPGIMSFQKSLQCFLDKFGHLSDSSSDFSQQPWRENPDLVLQMVLTYQVPDREEKEQIKPEGLDLPLLHKPLFSWLVKMAQRFQLQREAISSLYTYGYGQFRGLFLSLGKYFQQSGVLQKSEDIFFLYLDEIRKGIQTNTSNLNFQEAVQQRKTDLRNMKRIHPPETIYGKEAPPVQRFTGKTLKGVAASRGAYTGSTRILYGLQDMEKVQTGDVLVVPYSDVGWTPLFAQAGAIVAESGGILSHCSIVAREYGIPAVVSVPGACQLPDEARVHVDGHKGEIQILDSDQASNLE